MLYSIAKKMARGTKTVGLANTRLPPWSPAGSFLFLPIGRHAWLGLFRPMQSPWFDYRQVGQSQRRLPHGLRQAPTPSLRHARHRRQTKMCGVANVELRRQDLMECRQRMPVYMVPARIDIRSGPLPRNPNGKIDRKLLSGEFQSLFVQGAR